MLKELILIRRIYGEEMMKFCRKEFSTILETEGLLISTLESNFDRSKYLFEDLVNDDKLWDFKRYITSITTPIKTLKIASEKSPEELLKEAGYNLYECTTEEELNYFAKYYAEGELLCTFWDDRLKTDYVFFAVKHNVDKINRIDFKEPKRQDEYGTSVLSIQFKKDETKDLSIKNRYNHAVANSNATFSNNLDYIIPGLTYSFSKHKNLTQKTKEDFQLKDYVKASDGKYYKCEYEINGVLYGENNVIIDRDIILKLPKEKYLLMDYILLDLENKKITLYDPDLIKRNSNLDITEEEATRIKRRGLYDAFNESITDIEKINIINQEDKKLVTLKIKDKKDVIITLNNRGNILSIKDPNIAHVRSFYLSDLTSIEEIDLENAITIDNFFLYKANKTKKINLPNAEVIGDSFVRNASRILEINLPSATIIGNEFIEQGMDIIKLNLPKTKKIGNNFLFLNIGIRNLNLESLEEAGNGFISNNANIEEIHAPNLIVAGDSFLYLNREIKSLYFPNLTKVGNDFFYNNDNLSLIFLPNLEEKGKRFMPQIYNEEKEQTKGRAK